MRGNLIGDKAKPQAKSKVIVLKSNRERTSGGKRGIQEGEGGKTGQEEVADKRGLTRIDRLNLQQLLLGVTHQDRQLHRERFLK